VNRHCRPAASVAAWSRANRQDTANGRLAGKCYQTGMFRLALVVRAKRGEVRADALAPIIAWLRALAWARLRVVLEARGLWGSRCDDGPPVLGEVLMRCCIGVPGPPVAGRSGSRVGLAHVVMTGGP
jgi:hypothetical protein